MSKLAITRDSNYRNYPLLDYDGPGRGFYTAILDRLIDRLEYQLAAHGKVLMIRLVAKYPDEVTVFRLSMFGFGNSTHPRIHIIILYCF